MYGYGCTGYGPGGATCMPGNTAMFFPPGGACVELEFRLTCFSGTLVVGALTGFVADFPVLSSREPLLVFPPTYRFSSKSSETSGTDGRKVGAYGQTDRQFTSAHTQGIKHQKHTDQAPKNMESSTVTITIKSYKTIAILKKR